MAGMNAAEGIDNILATAAAEEAEADAKSRGVDLDATDTADDKDDGEAHLSRREAARQAAEAQTAKLAEIAENQRRFESDLARKDAEIARLHGAMQERQAAEVRAHQERLAASRPNPMVEAERLEKEAEKLLDEGKFTEYQRVNNRAVAARVLAAIPPRQEVQQQAQQPMLDPAFQVHLSAQLGKYPELSRDANWTSKVISQANVLLADGDAPGPELIEKAFKQAAARVTPQRGRPSFSRDTGALLEGEPHVTENQDGGGTESLSPAQRLWAAKFGISHNDYRKLAAEKGPKVDNTKW